MRTILIVGFGLCLGLVGCSKSGDGTSPAGSGGTTGASAAPAAGGKPTTSLTEAQIDDAYKLADPDKIDKSIAAVTGKLGAPTKTEGDASIWYAVSKDGKGCIQLKISKAKGIDQGSTDKANCGLK